MNVRSKAAWTGLLFLALALWALEWRAGRGASLLPLRMLAAAAAGILLFRAFPWARLLRAAKPGGAAYRIALFFAFLVHFSRVLGAETRVSYIAWRQAAPRLRGPRGWRALAHSTSALLERALRRAERFYASLLLRGVEP